jgi:hypothetical protein
MPQDLLRNTPHPTFANAKATFPRKGGREIVRNPFLFFPSLLNSAHYAVLHRTRR